MERASRLGVPFFLGYLAWKREPDPSGPVMRRRTVKADRVTAKEGCRLSGRG